MSLYRLESSDGKILTVDAATVKQMVTIQTMIDHEDEDSDEVTPVPTVKAQVLEKIIKWIEYHKIDHEKTGKIDWYFQYFNVNLEQKFEIINAADYLEVENLLNESCSNVLINHKWKIIVDSARNFHDPIVINLLEKHEREHGYEVVVTMINGNLKYFDIRVTNFHIINIQDIPILD